MKPISQVTPVTETTCERLRTRVEDVVRREPAVEAVVLFGSRARGTAGPRSDWDVTVIERNGKAADTTYRLLDDLPGVRPFRVGADEIDRHKDTAGAVEAALAREGITLAGAWDRPDCRVEGPNMDIGCGQTGQPWSGATMRIDSGGPAVEDESSPVQEGSLSAESNRIDVWNQPVDQRRRSGIAPASDHPCQRNGAGHRRVRPGRDRHVGP